MCWCEGGWSLADRETLLSLWDTQQSALRALVEQWRADHASAQVDYYYMGDYKDCADALERLLTPEQS